MASDRDTLTDVILAAKIDGKTSDETADDILAAGWRPPAQPNEDDLAAALERTKLPNVYREWVAVVLEGWRPPAQVITDRDTPDTYPAGTVAIDRDGDAWQSEADSGVECWACGADVRSLGGLVDAYGPLTVVYVPTEEAESRA